MHREKWRTIYCNELSQQTPGALVTVSGWIEEKRNLGALLFLVVRDLTGKVQIIVDQKNQEIYDRCSKLTRESSVSLQGTVEQRAKNLSTAHAQDFYEILATTLLFASISAPFPINLKETINEETDLRYRYLTMRKPEVLKRYQARARIASFFRTALEQERFIEIETPILSKPTPEGARDYLVPSRIHSGKFYALPQSPQLYKQLCMIGGLDRYYQIARCFRDEDLRSDRQPEFTQIDMEVSFLKTNEFRSIVEKVIRQLWEKETRHILPPLQELTYAQAMNDYGSDKPDLRFDCPIVEGSDLFQTSEILALKTSSAQKNHRIAFLKIPQAFRWSRNQWDAMLKTLRARAPNGALFVLDCVAEKEGDAPVLIERFPQKLSNQEKASILNRIQLCARDVIIMMAGLSKEINVALGELRLQIPKKVPEVMTREISALWVVDFPMFERDDHQQLQALHHPFTAAQLPLEQLSLDPSEWIADAYDLVINGYEIGGGSRRIVDAIFQKKVFSLLNISNEEQKARFGFFLNALSFGAPIHCGIALGLDRIVMLLTNSAQLRDVIAFPKTATASCLMTQAPTQAVAESLELLKLKTI